jgi:tRNA threonylcarbamoyladenosine biosynthesis protein TsaE
MPDLQSSELQGLHTVSCVDETNDIASQLARTVQIGDIVFLNGELGAGKTTFTKAFARELGVTEDVLSPTFVLAREYDSGKFPLLHIDAYRIVSNCDPNSVEEFDKYVLSQLQSTELEEILDEGVVIVEWGDSFAVEFPNRYEVNFVISKSDEPDVIEDSLDNYREIEVKKYE